MTLILKNQKQQRIEPFDPQNPVTFESVDEQHCVDDAQIVFAANRRFTDANGRRIDEDSRLIVSSLTGAIVNAEDAYQCLGCFRYGNKNERAKIIEPPDHGSTSHGTPAFAERSGYCPLCWRTLRWTWSAKIVLRLLLGLMVLVLRPIFDAPTAVPKGTQPPPSDGHQKMIATKQAGKQP
jgi:hypothetical protein